MSLLSLLNQVITHYPRAGYGADGRATTGDSSSINSRFMAKQKRVLLPNGNTLTIDAYAIIGPDESISTNDRVDYGTQKYKVVDIYQVPGGNGDINHQEVRLVKWQEV